MPEERPRLSLTQCCECGAPGVPYELDHDDPRIQLCGDCIEARVPPKSPPNRADPCWYDDEQLNGWCQNAIRELDAIR